MTRRLQGRTGLTVFWDWNARIGSKTALKGERQMSIEPKDVSDLQYELIAARRSHYDYLLWQTPVISLTGQAFLFQIAWGTGDRFGKIIASILAFLAAFASMQLLGKHRYMEVFYAKMLTSIEVATQRQGINDKPPTAPGVTGWSSVTVWHLVFLVFGIAALVSGFKAAIWG
jgi:hypothetical protein